MIQIFLYGVLAGICASVIVYFSTKRSKIAKPKEKKEEEIDISNMKPIPDFNEHEYTQERFDIALHSIKTDKNWNSVTDNTVIKLRRTDGGLSVVACFEYSFSPKNHNGIFRIDIANIVTSTGSYGREYRFNGTVDHEMVVFLYKIYIDWKNKSNEDRKIEINRNLETFNTVVGKVADRDKKIDGILNN